MWERGCDQIAPRMEERGCRKGAIIGEEGVVMKGREEEIGGRERGKG